MVAAGASLPAVASPFSAPVDGAPSPGSASPPPLELAATAAPPCESAPFSAADTAPFPKNINRAATATLAAPKLYLRIE